MPHRRAHIVDRLDLTQGTYLGWGRQQDNQLSTPNTNMTLYFISSSLVGRRDIAPSAPAASPRVFGRLFLGGVLPSKARFRFAGRASGRPPTIPAQSMLVHPVLIFLSHSWGAVHHLWQFFAVFPEIISERRLAFRRNPRSQTVARRK